MEAERLNATLALANYTSSIVFIRAKRGLNVAITLETSCVVLCHGVTRGRNSPPQATHSLPSLEFTSLDFLLLGWATFIILGRRGATNSGSVQGNLL